MSCCVPVVSILNCNLPSLVETSYAALPCLEIVLGIVCSSEMYGWGHPCNKTAPKQLGRALMDDGWMFLELALCKHSQVKNNAADCVASVLFMYGMLGKIL